MLEYLRAPFVSLATLWPFWLVLSACVGSFLSMVAYRLPLILDAEEKGEAPPMTLSAPASACAHCSTPLRWYHNLPFIGFLLVHRATPCCAKPVPVRYLAFEASATLWGALVWFHFHGAPLQTWAWSIFGWVMLVAAAIDARTQWLPDVLTLPLLWAGLVFGALGTGDVSLAYRIFAIVGVYLTLRAVAQGFFLLRGVHGLGGGDIKLLAALAAWLPLSSVAYVLLIGSALQLAGMALTRTRQSPFGPCLCVAAVGCLLANWWA